MPAEMQPTNGHRSAEQPDYLGMNAPHKPNRLRRGAHCLDGAAGHLCFASSAAAFSTSDFEAALFPMPESKPKTENPFSSS